MPAHPGLPGLDLLPDLAIVLDERVRSRTAVLPLGRGGGKQNEGSYLAGLYAGLMTQKGDIKGMNPDKRIGVIGGQDIPVLGQRLP